MPSQPPIRDDVAQALCAAENGGPDVWERMHDGPRNHYRRLADVALAFVAARLERQERYGWAFDAAHPWQDMIAPHRDGRWLLREDVLGVVRDA